MEIQGTLKPPTTDTHKEATEQGPWAQLFGTFWAPQRGVPSSRPFPKFRRSQFSHPPRLAKVGPSWRLQRQACGRRIPTGRLGPRLGS